VGAISDLHYRDLHPLRDAEGLARMSTTSIEWATHVSNPFTGCDRVSPGCAHCYALDYAARLKVMPNSAAKYANDGNPKTSGPGFGFTVHDQELDHPKRFPKGARVFVNSMSDVFHEEATDEQIARLFASIGRQHWANFLILTKRPERMHELLNTERFGEMVGEALYLIHDVDTNEEPGWAPDDPSPNVWLGISIENRRFVDRADLLRETPAAVRFISAEPLLGPLVYDDYENWEDEADLSPLCLRDIDWMIVGGESGPKHRPIDADWVRMLRDSCLPSCGYCEMVECECGREAYSGRDIAFFFKQWGGKTAKSGGRELDGRTWSELPAADPCIYVPGESRAKAAA
jgi:protein gp37